jgi:hypothetical protein
MLDKFVAIDKSPMMIRLAQRPFFKIIILVIFAVLLSNTDTFPPIWRNVAIVTISLITFMPTYRYVFLFSGMFALMINGLLIKPEPDWMMFRANYLYLIFKNDYPNAWGTTLIKYVDLIIMLVVSESLVFLTTRYKKIKLFQFPITIYFCFLLSLILIASFAHLSTFNLYLLWSLIAIVNHYFWFVCYTLHENRFQHKRNFLLDYARYLPVWGFTALPYGKGTLYLQQVEAKTSEEFAVTQLKAIKLAWWAFILYFILHMFYDFEILYQMPRMNMALAQYQAGLHYPAWKAWLCLIDKFFRMMLELTVMGHFIVATCRMCGFRILRNTYKPLQAQTIAEYWNRYNYYFKELLVEFFFYPAFFKFFKGWSRLRMFCATLSAATFGNILFHFLLLTPVMMGAGLVVACKGFIAYSFYALILGLSIGFSQLWNLGEKRKPNKLIDGVISPILVLIFYCLLGLFNAPYQKVSILVDFKFFGSLFGFTW